MRDKFLAALLGVSMLLVGGACSRGTTGTAGTTNPAPTSAPATSAPTSAPATSAPAATPTAAGQPGAAGAKFAVAEVNAAGMGGAFNPPTVSIHVGDTVEWTNSSGNIHNVTFTDGMHSPVMFAGEKWSQVFTKPGTYKYTCTYHPGMDGTVVVT